MKVVFKPMPGKIVVQVQSAERTASGLILLADVTYSRIGKVIAVYEPFTYPNEEEFTEPYLKEGDLVIFGRHSGVEVTVEREKVVVLKENEVLTKIEMEDGSEP